MTGFSWLSCCAAALLCVVLWAPCAQASPAYDDGAGNGCVQCHTGFQNGNGPLHNNHVNKFGITFPGGCDSCHPNGFGTTPVLTYFSGPSLALGCAGCHGRDYGETSPNSGQPKATGYGLRQHHVNMGVSGCPGCHVPGNLGHPNPLPAILPESVAPPYYGLPTNNLTNPCDSSQEDMLFDGDLVGLDNDGDTLVDAADPDCVVTTTTTSTSTSTTTSTLGPCASTPLAGCASGFAKARLVVSEKAVGKEKMVAKWTKGPALVGTDYGNPLSAGGTGYQVCVYDDAGALAGQYLLDRAGAATCTSKLGLVECWKNLGKPPGDPNHRGYRYKDKATAADGILSMLLKAGDDGKSRATVRARNNADLGQTALPLGVAAALTGSSSVTVQLVGSDAPQCLSVDLSNILLDDGLRFKASNF